VEINCRSAHSTNLHKILKMFGGLAEEKKRDEPFSIVDTSHLIDWMLNMDIETWRDNIIEVTETTWKEKFDKIKKHKDTIL
jgi:hypothetical protein